VREGEREEGENGRESGEKRRRRGKVWWREEMEGREGGWREENEGEGVENRKTERKGEKEE